ncbi:MAG: formylglycine-generating enzyme family protein [Deltaproteobacteria bacterium]|nr:formylglycine-generating enzyme family protein [Deltaproteobacteria bacterium]
MKVNSLRILIIIASTFIFFTASPALSYVPDDLDFVPMGDSAVSAAPSGRIYTASSINYKMVYISPGTFMMGSPSSEPKRDSDERQHKVALTKDFYMGVTEITQSQWRQIMGNNPSKFKGDNLPVEQVSWNDCQEFIRKLNQQEGGNKYRLPTEAEWEYACRAGTTTPFYTGNCISTDQANYDGNYPMPECSKGRYRKKTIEVASFPPNAWGLYDMHGNVWEWCQDWYEDYQGDHVTDTEEPFSGSYRRVDRGGGWNDGARRCRSANRYYNTPANRYDDLGFRLARTP